MVKRIFIFHVVIADDIQPVGKGLGYFFPAGIQFAAVRVLEFPAAHLGRKLLPVFRGQMIVEG